MTQEQRVGKPGASRHYGEIPDHHEERVKLCVKTCKKSSGKESYGRQTHGRMNQSRIKATVEIAKPGKFKVEFDRARQRLEFKNLRMRLL